MAIQDDSTLLTKGDLKEYHEALLPYLGGNAMLSTNVSDYYSTDEKIVGVWTNGKPIYQKTITCNLGNATTVNTAHNISNLDSVIDMFGYGKDASGNSFPVPYAPVGNISWGVQIYVSATNISCVTGQNWTGSTVKITLRYTKTTDAAGSAVTIPGCYDISRPDLWPTNKEIFFGNGLYGYRKTDSNITVAAGGRVDLNVITTGTPTTRVINSGGCIYTSSWEYPVPSTHLVTGKREQFFWFNKSAGGFTANTIILYMGNGEGAAITYDAIDAWVTYTK